MRLTTRLQAHKSGYSVKFDRQQGKLPYKLWTPDLQYLGEFKTLRGALTMARRHILDKKGGLI